MSDWITFFDSDHAIYVNARHKQVHAIITGDGMMEHIAATDRVLDYGCGEAAYAERLVRKAAQLTLCEAAPSLRERLKARVAHERYDLGAGAGRGCGVAGRFVRRDHHALGFAISVAGGTRRVCWLSFAACCNRPASL